MKSPWGRPKPVKAGAATTETVARALLISIQPRFANAILAGTKTIELRRTAPTLQPEALAFIYSSSPTKALVGWATVEETVVATPTDLWKEHQESAGVTSAEFEEYFSGTTSAYGLRLSTVIRADHEISLTALRTYGLQPPQSWRYVPADLAEVLRRDMSPLSLAPHSLRPQRIRNLISVTS